MAIDVDDLLQQWEDGWRQGAAPDPKQLCRDRPEVLDELNRQIRALKRIEGYLDSDTSNGASGSANPSNRPAGDNHQAEAPRYQTLHLHAKGGLGEVFLGRDQRLGRPVALKRMQERHVGDSNLRQRFLREAAITARLQHPGIVPVYDVSESDDGQPIYAMRFIGGESLETALAKVPRESAADFRSPQFRDLMHRLIDVCNAMAYAHDRGVIHRDLKPANIMLGAYGETLVVDWGLAKETDAGSHELGIPTGELNLNYVAQPSAITAVPRADATQAGSMLGTPAYMSPEQAAGQEVTPASDVYSLGATLYHVLTGSSPVGGAVRSSQHQEINKRAFIPPRALKPHIPAALEAVCLKAMALDPQKRYESALVLGQELDRWLSDEPVTARREPLLTRAARQLRRHGKSATALMVLMATGLIASVIAAALVQRQQHRTIIERDRSEAVRRFLQDDLLRQADAWEQANSLLRAGGSAADVRDNPTIHDLLNRAALALAPSKIEENFPGQPDVQGEILLTVGRAYTAIGQYDDAIHFLNRGVEQYQQLLGRDDPVTLAGEFALATALRHAGKLPESISIFEHIRDVRERGLGIDHPDTLSARHGLALTYHQAGRDEALPLLEEVGVARTRILGREHPDTLTTLGTLAEFLREIGRTKEAITLLEEVCAARNRILGPEHPNALISQGKLATAYMSADRIDDALRIGEPLCALTARQLGPDHPETLSARNNYAVALRQAGRLSEAISLFEQVRDTRMRKLGLDHARTLTAINNLASAHYSLGHLPIAIELYQQVHAALAKKLGAAHPTTLAVAHNLGEAYWATGNRVAEAVAVLEPTAAARAQKFGAENLITLTTQQLLALAYRDVGRTSDAIAILEKVRDGRALQLGIDHPDTLITQHNLAATYHQAGRFDEAIELFEQVRSVRVKAVEPDNPNLLGTVASLSRSYLAGHRFAEAEALLRPIVAERIAKAPDAWATADFRSLLGESLRNQKKFADAEPLLLDAARTLLKDQDATPNRGRTNALHSALSRLVQLYEEWGRPEDAATWRKLYDSIVAMQNK